MSDAVYRVVFQEQQPSSRILIYTAVCPLKLLAEGTGGHDLTLARPASSDLPLL